MTEQVGVDYRATLNLPKTGFPMRANLARREPGMQESWDEMDLYRRLREERKGRRRFVLHDGPPYANGEIHVGTAANKILKDFIVRHASMQGYDAPFVPGWDTHGLPIEHRAIQELGLDRRKISDVELRDKCEQFARSFIGIMTDQFRRLGCMGDWDDPYITLNPAYEAAQIRVFGEMARRGYIYKGLKTVHWCPHCETAMAEAEIEYDEKRSPSIYVAFPLKEGEDAPAELPEGTRALIWTTTPWTLPANMAITLHADFDYVVVDTEHGPLLMADELKWEGEVLARFKGARLEGVRFRHPLYARDSVIVLGDHVTLEDGTGAVHTAPAHGQEDFEMAQKYDLDIPVPIDARGRLTREAGPFAELFHEDANEVIIDALQEAGALLDRDDITHQYPHCWRCRNPVLWRATEQWFASIGGFREETLKAIEDVEWFPARAVARIRDMVAGRADWCISRQRVWGVPIPAFYCRGCDHILIEETIDAVAEMFAAEGSRAWFSRTAEEILPPGTACPKCGGGSFDKETDTMDVWFDSGSSHAAVLETRPELHWPADVYLEGTDQHRGWFQSSLLTAVATRGQAPYRAVVTHGFVVDGQGRAMSKSLGNGIDPFEVIQEYGADILRLWVAAVDYRVDMRLSPEILKQTAEAYRKIRNTLRFMLGNLHDYDPEIHGEAVRDYHAIDRWLLASASKLVDSVSSAYGRYEYHPVYQLLHNFCVVELSSFYLDVVKDRLYAEEKDSPGRRAAQHAIYTVARALIKMLAPILVHTAEEAWTHLPKKGGDAESVHLVFWPQMPPLPAGDEQLLDQWRPVLSVRDQVSRRIEMARSTGLIKAPSAADVTLYVGGMNEEGRRALERMKEELPTLFRVAAAVIDEGAPTPESTEGVEVPGLGVEVAPTASRRCERCWRYTPDVGSEPARPDLCRRCAAVLSG